ncbi:hypothetical protein CR513_53435, partial [Mucuna pruriens]
MSRLGQTILAPDAPSTRHSERDRLRPSEPAFMHNKLPGLNINPDRVCELNNPLGAPRSKEKWESLEEKLHVVEGGDKYRLEAVDLCLVSDVGLPADFKTPEFDKYKGSSCPRVHLAMYYRKMVAYIYDDKILIHYFQDNLTGVVLSWYVSLERGRIKTWRDLEAFLKHGAKSFLALEHAQEGAGRLQGIRSKVQPLITEREMVTMFIDTLPSPYYDKVVGNVASSFTDLVVVGERIELGIRRGNFAQSSNSVGFSKKLTSKKKKGEMLYRSDNRRPAQQNTRRTPRTLDPIPMSYTELLPLLLKEKLLETIHIKPLEPPHTRSYDPSARCDYHGGVIGHPTEICWSLKHKVQDLIDGGYLRFRLGRLIIIMQSHGVETTPPTIKEDPIPEVTNIVGIGGVTRSGRVYALEGLRNKDLTLERKDKAVEAPKRIVTEGEATEFLKLIRHKEYEMLDQMHKTLARSLLINYEGYRSLLLKVLNDAHVAQDITPEKFGGIINNTMTSRHLSLSEDEVPTEGRSHNQPLHIIVKCGNYMIARMLIDNGSSLNVMPKVTLDKLYSIESTLRTSYVVVRAFDRSKRDVMGDITLPIRIQPTTFDITF